MKPAKRAKAITELVSRTMPGTSKGWREGVEVGRGVTAAASRRTGAAMTALLAKARRQEMPTSGPTMIGPMAVPPITADQTRPKARPRSRSP